MKSLLTFSGGLFAGALLTFVGIRLSGSTANSSAKPVAPPPVTVTLDPESWKGPAHLRPLAGWRIDDPRISMRTLERIAEERIFEDPVAAVEAAKSIPGHDNREAYLFAALSAWGENAGAEAARWVSENFNGAQLSDALYFVADGWAEANPEDAANWFQAHTEGTIKEDALWEALESWGRKDAAAAFAWTNELDDYTRFSVMDGLAEGWAAIDPQAAAEAAMEMVDSNYGYFFLTAVTTQWAGIDPQATSRWAGTILQEDLREGVLTELGEIWANTDPEAAAAWAGRIEDPGNRRFAQSGIAIGWSEHDPAGALKWALESSTESAQVDEMVADIVFNWSNEDPRGAALWLQEAPLTVKTDVVLDTFSESIFDLDPESAVSWAAEISDPVQRDTRVRELLAQWIASDRTAAHASIRKLSLPEAIKAEFLAP